MFRVIKNIYKLSVLACLSLGLFYSCKKEFDYGKVQNAVKTLESSNILQTSAMVSGEVIKDNGARISERGICYGFNSEPNISGLKKRAATAELGNFTCTLDTLAPGTTYYARAYATNSYGTAYGKVESFVTKPATVPIISSTTAATLITATSAQSGGTITNSGASNIISKGVCWSSTVTIPTLADTKTNNGTGVGAFTSALTSLSPSTRYYIRAYATNAIGTAFGDVKTFNTTSATIPIMSSTTGITAITFTSANSGGVISSDGGSNITSRGVCWSSFTSAPTISGFKTIDGAGVGAFASSLSGLSAGTTHYVRAYATNGIGTAYAPATVFTTIAATIPTGIITNSLSSIAQSTASCGGTITSDGGTIITARGVCWSSSTSSPTISNSKTIDGNGTGSFTSFLSGLNPGTTYYVRAYATNSIGTGYGAVRAFTTSMATIPSGIVTNSIISITQFSANGGGSVSSDGGASITSRGVCWSSTTSTPTIFNSSTNNGTGIGSFSSSLTGLNANTTYYVRAYATNSAGTAYGSTSVFTTSSSLVVGQSYQGGIIAYIFVSGDVGYVAGQTHGLITTTFNQNAGAQWGCSGTFISGTSLSLGSGPNNTTAIINGCATASSAARICSNLSSGGFTDWYLPSRDELTRLFNNRAFISVSVLPTPYLNSRLAASPLRNAR